MQKLKIFFLSLILFFAISTGVRAEFFSDVIVTSPNGIWTDSRSYTTLNDAVTAVGVVNQRTIVIASPQTVTALTVPSNITLKFERDGAIVNSGQLTINTKNIISDGHKIFAGLGDIDFAAGTVVKLSWFHNLWNALTMTSDDHVTMVIDKAINATASVAVGNDVTLRWEAPNIITANAGVTVSNIGQIEAGSYQILAGAGNFRFRDGISLNLEWFPYLRTALTWINTTDATIVVNESSDVDYSDSVPLNIQLKINNGGALNIAPGVTLTIANNKQLDIGPCLFDPFTGTGSVAITGGTTYSPATTLTATALCTLSIDPIITTYGYEVDVLISYGNGTNYTDTALMDACTAVGSDVATILLRPGTWTQSVNRDYSAVCPNAILKVAPGAVISHGAYTIIWGGAIDALPTQRIFSGTGLITYKGVKYPEWYGAKDDSGTTDNTEEIQAAIAAGGQVELSAPNGGYYKITDTLTASVAGTKIVSDSKAEIRQATANKGGISISASNIKVHNIKITGSQHTVAAGHTSEKGIYAAGADSSNYLSNITIEDCDINNWYIGILGKFISDFSWSNNKVYDIYQTGIETNSCSVGKINFNHVTGPDSVAGGGVYGIAITRITNDAGELVSNPRSSDIDVIGNYLTGVTNWEPLDTHAGQRIKFIGNTVTNSFRGIVVGPAKNSAGVVTYAPLECTVEGNILDSGVTDGTADIGIVFEGALSVESATGKVTGNIIKGFGNEAPSSSSALYSYQTLGVNISDNIILSPGRTGIYLSTNSVGLSLKNNLVYDSWSNSFNVRGIQVAAPTSSVFIDNNRFIRGDKVATYTFSTALANGIRVESDPNIYALTGLNYYSGVTTGLYDAGTRVMAYATYTPGPIAVNATADLTAANLMRGLITSTHTTGGTMTLTLPTGALLDAGLNFAANDALDWMLINLSAAVADTVTIAAAAGHTIVGGAIVQSAHASTGALYGSSAKFRTVKTAANTFITYRIN